ncbi:unnamed protein product, partial [marine sediment metagenome]
THQSTFSLSETFDVGQDRGTQVSTLYKGFFPFKGTLDKVIFKLTSPITKEEKQENKQADADVEYSN